MLRARHLRIQGGHLGLQGGYRSAATPKDLHADLRQLLVPRRELVDVTTLQEVVAPSQNLPVPAVSREVGGLYLGRESIDEVAPGLRPSGENDQILPSERNDTGPRARLTRDDPATIFTLRDAPAHLSLDISSRHTSAQGGSRRTPERQIHRLGATKRSSHEQDTHRFQEVGFPLGVGTAQDVETGFRMEGKGAIITKFSDRYPLDEHPMFAPMRTSNSHRHDNTQRTFLLEAFDDSGTQTVLQFEHNLLRRLCAQRIQHVA